MHVGRLIERPTAVATRSRSRSRGPVVCSKLGGCVRVVDQMHCAANVSVFHPPLFVVTPAAVRPNDLLTRASYAEEYILTWSDTSPLAGAPATPCGFPHQPLLAGTAGRRDMLCNGHTACFRGYVFAEGSPFPLKTHPGVSGRYLG